MIKNQIFKFRETESDSGAGGKKSKVFVLNREELKWENDLKLNFQVSVMTIYGNH
jgi:hypothetical protein